MAGGISKIRRVSPRSPEIKGVKFPRYVDTSFASRRTEKQVQRARELLRGKFSLEKTVLEWVGIELDRINIPAMDAVIEVLKLKAPQIEKAVSNRSAER